MTALQSNANWIFLRSLLRNPVAVGALAPSSPRLSRLVASSISPSDSMILEVGAGTGAITAALLENGVSHDRLFVIERDPHLATYLQERFPRVRVRCGDALHAASILSGNGIGKIHTVLSSLPIRNFKPEDQVAILQAILKTLAPKGEILQYTYAPNCPIPAARLGLKAECLGRVWMNLPPAAVWRFRRHTETKRS